MKLCFSSPCFVREGCGPSCTHPLGRQGGPLVQLYLPCFPPLPPKFFRPDKTLPETRKWITKMHTAHQPCPARNAICHKCHKRGHFQAVCRSRSVNALTVQHKDTFLGAVQKGAGSTDKWEHQHFRTSLHFCPEED